MKDFLGTIQPQVTSTATGFSPTLDTKTGNVDNPLWVCVDYSAAANTSGANAVWFEVWHSDDNVSFYLHTSGSADQLALTTVAQAGEQFIPLLSKKRYKQVKVNMTGAGTVPSISWNAQLCTAPW